MTMRTVKPRGPAKWVALGLVKIPGLMATHEEVSPATCEVDDKHFWLVEHDGLVFGSGPAPRHVRPLSGGAVALRQQSHRRLGGP